MESLDIRCSEILAKHVKPEEELKALDMGFLWHSVDGEYDIWYNSRSVRVDLSTWKTRRQKPVWDNVQELKRNDPRWLPMYHAYIKSKNLYPYPGDDELHKENKLLGYFDDDNKLIGLSKLREYQGAWETCVFVHDHSIPHFGRITLDHEIHLATQLGHKHIYIGSGYEKTCIYKGKLKGFEFWTGEKWNSNKQEFVKLCQRDSLVKSLQDLHDVSSS
jgi:hypothetical protein